MGETITPNPDVGGEVNEQEHESALAKQLQEYAEDNGIDFADLSWREVGLCFDMVEETGEDIFFGHGKKGFRPQSKARAACKECVVYEECFEYAMLKPEWFGMWSGSSENDREFIREFVKDGVPWEAIKQGHRAARQDKFPIRNTQKGRVRLVYHVENSVEEYENSQMKKTA